MTLGLPVQNGVSKLYPYIISASHALYTCTTTVGDNLTFEHIFSLAWVNSETHNLQHVFRPRGVVPYIGYIGMCRAKGYVFLAVLVWNRVWFVHSSLELGMFLEELATSSSFGDKTISTLLFKPTTVYVP